MTVIWRRSSRSSPDAEPGRTGPAAGGVGRIPVIALAAVECLSSFADAADAVSGRPGLPGRPAPWARREGLCPRVCSARPRRSKSRGRGKETPFPCSRLHTLVTGAPATTPGARSRARCGRPCGGTAVIEITGSAAATGPPAVADRGAACGQSPRRAHGRLAHRAGVTPTATPERGARCRVAARRRSRPRASLRRTGVGTIATDSRPRAAAGPVAGGSYDAAIITPGAAIARTEPAQSRTRTMDTKRVWRARPMRATRSRSPRPRARPTLRNRVKV